MRQLQVVKIGTSSIFRNGAVDYAVLSNLGYDLAKLKTEKETDSVLIVSGAIPLGMKEKGLTTKPNDPIELQSCARVGQPLLMEIYTQGLRQGYEGYSQKKENSLKLLTAQYLVTYHNLDPTREIQNIAIGLRYDINRRIIPLVNYNDGVDPTEVTRDNDNLAARLTKAIIADRLIILTDVDGLLDAGGNLVKRIREVNEDVMSLCRSDSNGTGGMQTKLEAAALLLGENIPTIIGNIKYGLVELIENESIRTIFIR